MNPATAFGVSRYLEQPTRRRIVDFLRLAWRRQCDKDPATLAEDLTVLGAWFRPNLSGKSARTQVQQLSRVSENIPPELTEETVIRLPGHRCLVTPEGRMLLDLLESEGDAISDDALMARLALLSEFYGRPYRERLSSVLSGGDARPNTIAFVVLLMINGSVGQERCFVVPGEPSQERRLAGAMFGVLDAFVRGIGGEPLVEKQRQRLRSNWVLTEAAPQFPFLVSHSGDSYWLREDERDMPEELGRALAARRTRPTVAELEATLNATHQAYKEERPVFSAQHLAHYQPNRAQSDLRRLTSAYRDSAYL